MIQKCAIPTLLAATVLSSPVLAKSTSAESQVCKVLEAAYTTATESTSPAYPLNVRPSNRALELSSFVPRYKRQLNLAAGEFDDLERNAAAAPSVGYRPICATSVKPTEFRLDGTVLSTNFSQPIFSANGALAIVEVSFQTTGRFGYGSICIVRRRQATWSATCHSSWVV